jgi:hypothetical protein
MGESGDRPGQVVHALRLHDHSGGVKVVRWKSAHVHEKAVVQQRHILQGQGPERVLPESGDGPGAIAANRDGATHRYAYFTLGVHKEYI